MKHTKLFTCMYGSKLYGTSTPTSDVDLKHIVLPALGDLLMGKQVKNVVNHTNKERNVRNTQDDVDEEFIPVQVFARDFLKGQTYALELAFAADECHAGQTFYDSPGTFISFVTDLKENFLTSNIKAMMGYAVNQANIYSFKGERVNAIQAVINAMASADYDDQGDYKLEDIFLTNSSFLHRMFALCETYPKYVNLATYDTGGGLMANCLVLCEKTMPYSNTLKHTRGILTRMMAKYGARAHEASADNVDWKAMMHAVRIVDEGLELLQDKKITLPFSQKMVDTYLAIKRGEVPIGIVRGALEEKLDQLKELEAKSTLPTSAELENEFNAWLEEWMFKLYQPAILAALN